MRRLAILVVAACALLTPTAQAGTLYVYELTKFSETDVRYSAAVGETNTVKVSYDRATRTFVLTDETAIAVAPEPSASTDGRGASTWCTFELRKATCRFEQYHPAVNPATHFFAELGDGADSATVQPDLSSYRIRGGPGDDTLRGNGPTFNPYAGSLDGNAGNDVLRGGPDNQMLDGGPGADVIDGGTGTGDMVTWAQSSDMGLGMPIGPLVGVAGVRDEAPAEGVHVRLDGYRNDGHGRGSEGDNVINVEHVLGTQYADLIVGGPGDEWLQGLEGDDRITGGAGRDNVSGGHGTNWLDLRDGEADVYECGSLDTVLADPIDTRPFQTAGCPGLSEG